MFTLISLNFQLLAFSENVNDLNGFLNSIEKLRLQND